MSLLGTVKQDLSLFWTKLTGTGLSVAEAFFTAAITDAWSQLKAEGLKIVSDAVAAAEAQGGTGEAKYEAAFAKAMTDLEADSITVAEHVLNAAIEAAVAQLNSSEAAVAATATAAATGA